MTTEEKKITEVEKEQAVENSEIIDVESLNNCQEQDSETEKIEQSLANGEEDSDAEIEEIKEEEIFIPGVTRDEFHQLTKKNQHFLVSLDRQLKGELHPEVEKKVYKEIAQTLIEGQANSQTAKHIYGTPTELAQVVREQELEGPRREKEARSTNLLIGIDGALFLGSLFTFVTGLSMIVSKNPQNVQGYMGIITVIVNYIVAGFAMLATAKYLPNPDAPKGEKGYGKYFMVSILSMMMWFFVVSGTNAILPRSINVILPGLVYMIIGGITFAYRYHFKRKYNVQGGVF